MGQTISKNTAVSVANLGYYLHVFEEQNKELLLQANIKNWSYWRVIKTDLFFFILDYSKSQKTNIDKTKTALNFKGRLVYRFKFWQAVTKLVWLKIKTGSKKIDLFYSLSENKILKNTNGQWVDVVLGDLLFINNQSKKILIEDFFRADKTNSAFNTTFYLYNFSHYTRQLKYSLTQAEQGLQQKVLTQAEIFFHLPPHTLRQYDWFEKFYRNYRTSLLILKILKPCKFYCNDILGTGLMAAAKKLNTPIVELQHGLMDEYYPQYHLASYFKEIDAKLPCPNRIAVFGKFHKNQLTAKGFWQEKEVVELGRYDLDVSLKNAGIQQKISAKKTILFITQYNYTQHLAEQLIEHFVANKNFYDNYFIVIKLHPKEPQESADWYAKKMEHNTQVKIVSTEYNINQLLPTCDYLVSFNSTCLLEALNYNIVPVSIADDNMPRGVFSVIGSDAILEKQIIVCNKVNDFATVLQTFNDEVVFNNQIKNNKEVATQYLYNYNYKANCQKLLAN